MGTKADIRPRESGAFLVSMGTSMGQPTEAGMGQD
jgi:hypothetical protein